MRAYIRRKMQRIVGYMEIIIAIIVTVVIAISIVNFVIQLASDPFAIHNSEEFNNFLDEALSLIIGIEFLKMIIIPTSDNVIETLLFAVARHIILDHGTDVMIFGVLSVAVLFLTKKYLLSEFEEVASYRFKGSVPVNTINATIQSNFIPDESEETIGEFTVKRLKDENMPVERGASVTIGNFLIRLGNLDKAGIPKTVFIHPLEHNINPTGEADTTHSDEEISEDQETE